MENIKNTIEDNGKIVIRISNKLAFSYEHEPDNIFIDDDMNNYRYATKEEESIYNANKSSDDRFYSLINAPELRHEILKERISCLFGDGSMGPKREELKDVAYKLVTSDIGRKYWEHELNNAKDKEIEALKKQVKSLIEYKDQLSKDLSNSNQWISLKTKKPLATESGAWDGLKSEQILVQDKTGNYHVAEMYEGTIDGSYFCNFYSIPHGYEIENVINWKNI